MIRAAIYCRLSDEDRNKKNAFEESESIQNQKSLLLDYCHLQNWSIAGIFCDEDMSGADRSRPQFNRMISECALGNIDVVLCKTQSRFSRDMEVVEHYIHNRFLEWGVRFIGLLDHADTEDSANKKSRQINGLVNEWYLEDLSENIKRTLRHKKQNGIYTGSFAPYGYRLDPNRRGKLFIDEPAAAIVRRIYSAYLSGMGYMKIAKELNAEGIPSPAAYKRLSGSKFRTHAGKPTAGIWTEAVIRQILLNPVYSGTLVQGKTEKLSYKNPKRRTVPEDKRIITENAHAPVIEPAEWQKVRQRIGGGFRSQKTDGKRHVFAGRIVCGMCGSGMWKMSYRLKDGRYEYFRCKATKCAEGLCTNRESIRLDVVYTAVEREIKALLSAHYAPDMLTQKKLYTPEQGEKLFSEADIHKQLLKQNCNIKQLYKDKLDGIIDNEVFCDIYKDIKADIVMLKNRLEAAKASEPQEQKAIPYIADFASKIVLDEYAISRFIEKIEIGQAENGIRKITIRWNI